MRVHVNAEITVCSTPISEFQALLLIGFEKGETAKVISDVNFQIISISSIFAVLHLKNQSASMMVLTTQ